MQAERAYERFQDNAPRPMTVFALVLVSFFVVTSGIAYDIINEPPSVGALPDPVTGKLKPVTFVPHRVNAQYIIEGLTGGLMYCLGAVGIILLDKSHDRQLEHKRRLMLLGLGGSFAVIGYLTALSFLRIKMPGYLRGWSY